MLVDTIYRVKARKDQRLWRGYCYRTGRFRRAIINLGEHNWRRKQWHKSIAWMIRDIIGTIDHEIGHAVILTSDLAYNNREEKFMMRWEAAGRWARQ